MSLFGSLEVARSGLYASRRGLDVIAKNVANVNTPGYTRQRVVTSPALYNLGVEVVTVEQIRDAFLDRQFRDSVGSLGEWQVKADALESMEDFLQEPSDHGLNQAISDFFNSLQEMAKKPETKETRSQVLTNAIIMTDTMQYIYHKLVELQQNQNAEVSATVDQINNYAQSIQELNAQIQRAEIGGQPANELRDQRNYILDQMSNLADITVSENPNGTVSVLLAGRDLVHENGVNLLAVKADKPNPIDGEGNLYSVVWADDEAQVSVTGGKLKGYLDIRDGTGLSSSDDPKFMGIPYFTEKLNLLAKTMAKAVNDIHTTGHTMPNESNGNVSETGVNFFVPANGEHEITAKNIAISQEIMDNVFNIATSDVPISGTNAGNRNIIEKIAQLRDSNSLTITVGGKSFNIGSFSGFTEEIATELANVSSKSQKTLEAEQMIANSVESRRQSVSGVSLDEEMSMLIQCQQAYVAAARVISAVDQVLDALINSLGR